MSAVETCWHAPRQLFIQYIRLDFDSIRCDAGCENHFCLMRRCGFHDMTRPFQRNSLMQFLRACIQCDGGEMKDERCPLDSHFNVPAIANVTPKDFHMAVPFYGNALRGEHEGTNPFFVSEQARG